ncbi:hypothetical protein AYK61_26310 [Rhodococcus sp. SBT000017]|jgi:hypothetical protein|uniref:Unannotated protein n=1 Tax=freshwater metagenome TaxID=449393 RepID=A0A6J7GBV0_9ZZZZ|nr:MULTISPECIES: hypothetical protein [Rhodococcus]MSX06950.1 hypothetical protein [Actinomycetota bacterium]RMB70243.1 hypothetical protein AYK61_26310 [Rhodococcus sp. SBT000017]
MNDDPVAAFWTRACTVLRELPEPGWDRIAGAVVDAVRAAPRGGWPIDMSETGVSDDTSALGTLAVSDLVLRGAIARAVRLDEICVPRVIEVLTDNAHLRTIRVELTARYGSELDILADRIRRTVLDVVDDIMGTTPVGSGDGSSSTRGGPAVDVAVTDIVDGNPLTS